jgi:carbon starvation protein
MTILAIVLLSAVVLWVGYQTYGRFVARSFGLDARTPTPAQTQNDGRDFIPTSPGYLLGQHFSAIAAAGPILGPILAGLMFGWAPGLIWILLGAILVGGVHDFAALVASMRHKARSIAEVVREHMSGRAYRLFLAFVWIALVYVIIAFTDVTAAAFVQDIAQSQSEGATDAAVLARAEPVKGAAVAGSSLLYLLLPLLMGLTLRLTKMSVRTAALIFVPLIFVCIWAGRFVPLDFAAWFYPAKTGAAAETAARSAWDLVLLGYCFVAALLPMWLLLQPRGFLGGFFMYISLAVAIVGIVGGGLGGGAVRLSLQYPAFKAFATPEGALLFPALFVTVACGACSGFHALVASGTTSRQLKSEPHARPVAYGAMLLEALVAVIALSTLMMVSPADLTRRFGQQPAPNLIYANGIAEFLGLFSQDPTFKNLAFTFGLLAFATFVYDTLDVCTRLGRYVLQEFVGWRSMRGAVVCTLVTLAPAAFLVTATVTNPFTGKPMPAWRYFWNLFGTSNQLLAALTLLGVTVWLRRAGKRWWLTAAPMGLMMVVTLTSLVQTIVLGLRRLGGDKAVFDYNLPVAVVLLFLAGFLLVEAVRAFRRTKGRAAPAVSAQPSAIGVAAGAESAASDG